MEIQKHFFFFFLGGIFVGFQMMVQLGKDIDFRECVCVCVFGLIFSIGCRSSSSFLDPFSLTLLVWVARFLLFLHDRSL